MVAYLRNFDRRHEIEAFVVTFGGKNKGNNKGQGKAKGRCEWEKKESIGENTLEEWWVKQLSDVLYEMATENYINPYKIHDRKKVIKKLLKVCRALGWEDPLVKTYVGSTMTRVYPKDLDLPNYPNKIFTPVKVKEVSYGEE
jgi:hypothetical protein